MPACQAEFPEVQRASEELEADGLRLLGVSVLESPLDAATYAAQNGATWLVLGGPDESDTGPGYPSPTYRPTSASMLMASLAQSSSAI